MDKTEQNKNDDIFVSTDDEYIKEFNQMDDVKFRKTFKPQRKKIFSKSAVLITDDLNVNLNDLVRKYKEEIVEKTKEDIRDEIHKIVAPHLEGKALSLFFNKHRTIYDKNKVSNLYAKEKKEKKLNDEEKKEMKEAEDKESKFNEISNELYLKFNKVLDEYDPVKGDFREYWKCSIGRWQPKEDKVVIKVKSKNGAIITYSIVNSETLTPPDPESDDEFGKPENKLALSTFGETLWEARPEVNKEELLNLFEKILTPEEFEIVKIKIENGKITLVKIAEIKGKTLEQIKYLFKKIEVKTRAYLKKSGEKATDYLKTSMLILIGVIVPVIFLSQAIITKLTRVNFPQNVILLKNEVKKENKEIKLKKKSIKSEPKEANWQKTK